jgi:CMP-N,N'-diacetyllegionaminic acid synthase
MKTNLENVKVIVPARIGSQRVKAKSFRHLNGKPLITYILGTLRQTAALNDVYINSDSELFQRMAKDQGVKFYHRDPKLGTSASLIDDYIYDFILKEKPAHLAVVNPTSPFIDAEQLDKAWRQYAESDCDTLLSCERIQTHCFLNGKAINFSTNGQHPRSQDLVPVQALNFAITIWDAEKFRKNYEENGFGVYTGKLGFFETEGWASIDIDYPEDFALAEFVGRFLESGQGEPPEEFPDYVEEFLAKNENIQN